MKPIAKCFQHCLRRRKQNCNPPSVHDNSCPVLESALGNISLDERASSELFIALN
jgi:hypothetical protein